MKKTKPDKDSKQVKDPKQIKDELQEEYAFDYKKARANRFASEYKTGSRVVVLDPDVAGVFTTPESVNAVLRALLETMPGRKANRRQR